MRKLLYIFATIIGLGLGACDIIDPTTGNETEIPETPQQPADIKVSRLLCLFGEKP